MDVEFIFKEIEKLRESITKANKLMKLNVINDRIIYDINEPVYMVAYDLLQQVYVIPKKEEQENVIFYTFLDYMSGDKFQNQDEFIHWLVGELDK